MNSGHDLGGMQGFGPVQPEPLKPVFHADWEGKALALTLAMAASGKWNLDKSRHARESLPPPQYLTSSYYQIWLAALEKLMVSEGLVTPDEMDAGQQKVPPIDVKGVLKAEMVPKVLKDGGPCDRPVETTARFKEGDKVRVKNFHPKGHTRAPRYVRGHLGTVECVNGSFVYPDTNAHDQGEHPDWVYTVRFDAKELWGEDARAGDSVMADLWESYLEQA